MLELFQKRYSCREFSARKIKDRDLHQILEAARLSPSSLGLEPWKFYATKDKDKIAQLGSICNEQAQVKSAAALVIITSRLDFKDYFANKIRSRKGMSEEQKEKRINNYGKLIHSMSEEKTRFYAREQAFIALANLALAATLLDINSCIIGGFDEKRLNEYLRLDLSKEVSTIVVALGYGLSAEIPEKSRFDFDEVVKFI
ncbi:nitroreductase family protein [Campylobacter troglodytis]|uniref:nitroreductase family protein n=1 Tax=Campylobacter troglodytis TaxID=654363 RepID=UPI00115C065B|nr:nitroreductase family protein [Campylobacter troglodytis]TQR60599.1 NAD(P)H-dependent oxidoreductase [Campylobacter troglodytis]